MIMPNKKNDFINYEEEEESRKKKATRALYEAFLNAEGNNWDNVIDIGLEYPENMDKIISRYYDAMPNKMKYLLPVKWYMEGGKASDAVCEAVKIAFQYRPFHWLGKGDCNGDIIDVFCCIKNGDKQQAKSVLSWATNYNTAYVDAMRINGRVFQGCINRDSIIAYDVNSCCPVIQYRSVYALQQVFPVLPISCLKKEVDNEYETEAYIL